MSSCFTIMYSWPSYFTSVPEYLLTITLSPFFTIIVSGFPSIISPGPISITSATCGFSCADCDNIIVSKYSGTEVKYEGTDYIIVKQDDILAVVE